MKKFVGVDAMRRRCEAAKNELEGFLFSTRDRLSMEEEDLAKMSTEEEVSAIRDALEATEDWLWEEGEDTTLEVSGCGNGLRRQAHRLLTLLQQFAEL